MFQLRFNQKQKGYSICEVNLQEIQYQDFSLNTHLKNLKLNKPSVCQFELTFRCGLHCRYCYSDCYNQPAYSKKELTTQKIKLVLDKIRQVGIIWLCFTGGDPLTRDDFLEVYAYAKKKGFIVTIFTNGYSMNNRIIKYLKENPPFIIELTLNAVSQDLYEKISQVSGSFERVMQGINLIRKAKLPLKIKTQATKDNLKHLPQIKKYLKGIGLNFIPNHILYPGLNKDALPCSFRISPDEVLRLYKLGKPKDNDCKDCSGQGRDSSFYPCVITSGDGIYLDPYGNMFLCNLIRGPKLNLLKADIKSGLEYLLSRVRKDKFKSASQCQGCNLKRLCSWCPGKAYLETGSQEKPLGYYCGLTQLIKKYEH